MPDSMFEKKSEKQLHAIADSSHQEHKARTGQVPGVRDEENESDDRSSSDLRSDGTYYITPPSAD